MQIFHIPTTVLLNLYLIFSNEIREFCGFDDNPSLNSVIIPFLNKLKSCSTFKFNCFLCHSEFDILDNFNLLKQCVFEKVFLPINPRNQSYH